MADEKHSLEDQNAIVWNVVVQPAAAHDKRFEQALRSARRALDLEPTMPFLLNTAGVAEYRAGCYEVALECLRKSDRGRSPDGVDRSVADVAFLAMCHARLGHPDEAAREIAELRRVQSLAERDPVEFGLLKGEAELIDEAIAVVEGA